VGCQLWRRAGGAELRDSELGARFLLRDCDSKFSAAVDQVSR